MSERCRLHGLDALRGIAALLVVGHHYDLFTGSLPILRHGYLAVDFFFMLSGYVMERTYAERLRIDLQSQTFLLIRLKRLWPTIAVGMLLGFLTRPDLLMLAAGLLLVPILRAGLNLYPLNGVVWSIFFELFANWLHKRFADLSDLMLMCIVAVSLIFMAAAAVFYGTYNLGSQGQTFLAGIPRCLAAYVTGMLLWRRWRDRPPTRIAPVLTLALIPALVVGASLAGTWYIDMIVTFAFPLVIAGALSLPQQNLFSLLGAMSFPLYAVHIPLIRASRMLGFGPGAGALIAIVAVAGFVLWPLISPRIRRQRSAEGAAR